MLDYVFACRMMTRKECEDTPVESIISIPGHHVPCSRNLENLKLRDEGEHFRDGFIIDDIAAASPDEQCWHCHVIAHAL